MKRPQRKGFRSWCVLLLDIAVVALSLVSAWGIRSTFRNLLFDTNRLLFILPYFIFVRVIVNLVFEDYRLSFYNFQAPDIGRILVHNAIPTALFLALRYFTLYAPVRIPTSIILSEYVLTFAGMVFIRILILAGTRRGKKGIALVRKKRAYFYGNVKQVEPESMSRLLDGDHEVEVEGIFTSDRLAWNLDYRGVRVIGGLDRLRRAVALNDSVSTLLIGGLKRRDEALELWRFSQAYSLSVYWVDQDGIHPVRLGIYLLDRLFPESSVPTEFLNVFAGKQFAVMGEESGLCRYIERMCSERNVLLSGKYILLTEPTGNSEQDVVFDLRYAVLWERGLMSGKAQESIAGELQDLSTRLYLRPRSPRLVVALPGCGPALVKRLMEISGRISVVFTEPYFTANGIGSALECFAWVESTAALAAGLFKVAVLPEQDSGILYFRSAEAVPLKQYVELMEPAVAPQDEGPDSADFLEEAGKIGLIAVETEYFQLYRLVRKDGLR